jgi:hypothetical protein
MNQRGVLPRARTVENVRLQKRTEDTRLTKPLFRINGPMRDCEEAVSPLHMNVSATLQALCEIAPRSEFSQSELCSSLRVFQHRAHVNVAKRPFRSAGSKINHCSRVPKRRSDLWHDDCVVGERLSPCLDRRKLKLSYQIRCDREQWLY